MGMATRIMQGMSTSLSKLLSLCISLLLQCSTAVPLCTCPDRLGESHSKFELTRNINRLHHRHIRGLLASCARKKNLIYCIWKWMNLRHFERLKYTDEDKFAVMTLKPVTFSLHSFHLSQGHSASHKVFTASDYLSIVNNHIITIINHPYHHYHQALLHSLFNFLRLVQYPLCSLVLFFFNHFRSPHGFFHVYFVNRATHVTIMAWQGTLNNGYSSMRKHLANCLIIKQSRGLFCSIFLIEHHLLVRF